eukprot:8094925-Pyramimonas_sp.AAC.1
MMGRHIASEISAILAYLIDQIFSSTSGHVYMLRLLGDYLGGLAQADVRRLPVARARPFSTWIQNQLRARPGPIHEWSKPRRWDPAQVHTASGPSSAANDICESQRGSWTEVWGGAPAEPAISSESAHGNTDDAMLQGLQRL